MSAKGVAGPSQFKSVISFGTNQQIFSDIGYFRGVLVALKHIRKEHIQLSRNVLLEFNEVGPVLCCSHFTRIKGDLSELSQVRVKVI